MKNRKLSPKKSLISIPVIVAFVVLCLLAYQNGAKWLRFFFVYLSRAKWARNLVTSLSLAKQVSRRFVAGETIQEAVDAAMILNKQGMSATLDFLGESVTDAEVAVASADEILALLDSIEASGVNANVSVKLSQLGLRIDPKLALANMRRILDVVIQSYLFRSAGDVEKLVDEGAWIRLCKGAYAEPPHIAFPKKSDTDNSFIELTNFMLSEKARKNGVFLGIATHDPQMIDASLDYVNSNQIQAKEFEFQMLFGIRRELQKKLVEQGYQVRIYVPYGTAWYPYLVRRLAEHPANLWFFINNLFRR